MTKKSKRKAIKTGYKNAEEPRSTTVNVGYANTHGQKRPLPIDNDSEHVTGKHISKTERKRLQRLREEEKRIEYERENNTRKVYPVDVWFLIGRYVYPESVQTFATLCRAAHQVTSASQFWLDMYKRYVKKPKRLPSHLRPNAITTTVGLRARVVRTIYHVYVPLARTIQLPLTNIPKIDENLMVESHWWRRLPSTSDNCWELNVKLSRVDKNKKYHSLQGHQCHWKTILSSSLAEPIKYNPEVNNRMLKVSGRSYVKIPCEVFGMCLTDVSVVVSRNMKNHKVRLYFHEYRASRKYLNSQAIVVTIDPIYGVEMLYWWDIGYPHPFDK